MILFNLLLAASYSGLTPLTGYGSPSYIVIHFSNSFNAAFKIYVLSL